MRAFRACFLVLFAASTLTGLTGCGDDNGGAAGSGGAAGTGGTAGAGGSGGGTDARVDAPIDANRTDGPVGPCVSNGGGCTASADCCSFSCDPGQLICTSNGGLCASDGMACSVSTDCCNLNCSGGFCGAVACKTNGAACGGSGECCSANCTGSPAACAPLPGGSCTTLGNACAQSGDCCSLNCHNGFCSRASSCGSTGDICFLGADCCTGICDRTASGGTGAGLCALINSTGAGNCLVDGTACSGGNGCCSRECVPTVYGGNACQVASGCRVEGEVCRQDSDCCGGGAGIDAGTASVTCVLDPNASPPIGRCRNPTGGSGSSCDPVGNVCGGTGDGGVNARQNCCDCDSPKWQCCKPDQNGVQRCFGGGGGNPDCPTGYTGTAPCCIGAGQVCVFASQCCGGAPCVPDNSGTLRCLMSVDGGVSCVMAGGSCTTPTDCCAGTTCILAPGSQSGTCGNVNPPPDAGTRPDGSAVGDAGTPRDAAPMPDAAICALPGQGCSTRVGCCFGLACDISGTANPCQVGQSCKCVIP